MEMNRPNLLNRSKNVKPSSNAGPLSFINMKPANNASKAPSMITSATNAVTNFVNKPSSISPPSIKEVNKSLSDLVSPIKDSAEQAMENTSDLASIPVMIGIGVLIVALILITIFRDQVAYGFQVTWDYLKRVFGPATPSVDPSANPSGPAIDTGAVQNMMPSGKEVFNIGENKYKYSDAEPLCKAYGAELATYDQVKDAWSKGADWCNYGWVKGQAAVYPTQDATYQKLQAGPEDQRGACGIPGVNGGYFDNPDLRFGVNCYGAKPVKTDTDERAQQKPRAMTNDAIEYDRKVRDYKRKLNEIPLMPFNGNQWA
jgi:hypothetical protein